MDSQTSGSTSTTALERSRRIPGWSFPRLPSVFGLVCLLVALQGSAVIDRIGALRLIAVAFAGTYFILSLRFWFGGPALITGLATICFVVLEVLSR